MTDLFVALTAVAGAWLVAFMVFQAAAAWRQWRGTRIVTCPETRRPAAVDMDLRYALAGAVVGRPELRLRDCSRWPERSSRAARPTRHAGSAPSSGNRRCRP